MRKIFGLVLSALLVTFLVSCETAPTPSPATTSAGSALHGNTVPGETRSDPNAPASKTTQTTTTSAAAVRAPQSPAWKPYGARQTGSNF